MAENEAPPPAPWRQVGADGAVRVYEYRCAAARGERPQPEQFARPSISVVRSGVFEFRNERRAQILSAGFVLVGEPGRPYEVSHEHGGGDRCLIFTFDEAVFDEAVGGRKAGGAGGYFARSVLPPLPRVDAIRRAAEARLVAGAPGLGLGLEEAAFALAACVAGAAGGRAPGPPTDSRRARDDVYGALALLERSSADDVHLADLARAAGLSPFHFLRLFKREVGVTPYRFLLQARLRRALDLLADTDRPVTEIAFEVGFGDLSNFINAFRREVGCSPGHFRKAGPGAALGLEPGRLT